MKKRFFIFLQYITPHHALSRFGGFLMNSTNKWLKKALIRRFLKVYVVNMAEAIETDPYAYRTFNDLFTRKLKPEARPISAGFKDICSPADGILTQFGPIKQGRIIQAKGFNFSVEELVGGDREIASQFDRGLFATIYLAPKDYHRVHMPLTGTLKQMIVIPGQLFSVNETTAQMVPRLFARNERVVFLFETETGPMIVVMVGACLVASIVTPWAGEIAPIHSKKIETTHYAPQQIRLAKGAELGYFKFGSTAIVLFPENRANWLSSLDAGMSVKMGQAIGLLAG
ncbi:MAG: archaetidylserine decarboxylase [Gammaproteobacteria bacterium]|nr:archaetidylserine decarboxylase [Gammaproteobacteria bacterium]